MLSPGSLSMSPGSSRRVNGVSSGRLYSRSLVVCVCACAASLLRIARRFIWWSSLREKGNVRERRSVRTYSCIVVAHNTTSSPAAAADGSAMAQLESSSSQAHSKARSTMIHYPHPSITHRKKSLITAKYCNESEQNKAKKIKRIKRCRKPYLFVNPRDR